jgi:indole-3-glycerol phosphate synthase
MILDTLAAASKKRAEASKNIISLEEIKRQAEAVFNTSQEAMSLFPLEKTLLSPGISFICEIKRASPSKGMIAPDFPYLEIAKDYERAGADAISVLTEPEYFLGSNQYLTEIRETTSLPLLRKDFTVDPYQIYEAKTIGASAILLICALLSTEELREYMKISDSLGLSSLVEAHNEAEVHSALSAGARIIGVNNRNLKTFQVDFENSLRLRDMVPNEVLFVAESGISTASDVRTLAQAGVHGVLVGESLMRAPNKQELIYQFKEASK